MGIYIPEKLIEELRNNPMDAWDLLEHDNAVTVKTPHGRLVDADDTNERIRQRLGIRNLDYLLEAEKPIVLSIKESPTVIEAEVE